MTLNNRGLDIERRRPSVFAASSGGTVSVLGIEVTQAVQNMSHDVRLIAGKKTIVRVYLKPDSLSRNVRVRGEILISRGPTSPARFVPSKNEISLKKTHPSLNDQRRDAELSLNFELPSRNIGPLVVQLNRVIPATRGDDVPITNPDLTRQVTMVSAPLLRVRVLGMRFTDDRLDPPQSFAPDASHFDYLKSYLTRTYPVSGLIWSQIVVNAGASIKPPWSSQVGPNQPDPVWQAKAGRTIARLQLIRQADVNAGRDPRTHYYGLFADNRGGFRGRASRVAATADPSVVAFGPTGHPSNYPSMAWDSDESFGDWYGAHELGHTFGCRHPGCRKTSNSPSKQGRDPQSSYPYALGRLSDTAEGCVGFDTGDPDLGVPMRAFSFQTSSDFMTYCDNQWISRHTYDELFDRIVLEDTQFAPQIST